MAGEDIKRARLHPIAKAIAKYPIPVSVITFAVFVLLGFVGSQNIVLSFGNPTGRSAYLPSDAIETERMDARINAQEEITVKSASAERQTVTYDQGGFVIFFEEEVNNEPALDQRIFTDQNLRFMLEAQHIIEKDPRYEDFCLRCPLEDSLVCERSKDADSQAMALESALIARENSTDTDNSLQAAVNSEAEQMVAIAESLLQIESSTKPLKDVADEVLDLVTASPPDNTAALTKVQDSLLVGTAQTRDGACGALPGCEDATKSKPKCQPFYSPLQYFYDDDDKEFNDIDDAWKKLDDEIDTPDAEDIGDRVSVFPASFYLPRYYEDGDHRAHMTRFTHLVGLPLDGYDDENDRTDEQEDKIHAWMITLWPKIEEMRVRIDADVKMRWVAPNAVINDYFFTVLQQDVTLVFGAIIFVYAYVRFHTGSFFLASTMIVAIVLCFFVGCFWSILVFNVRFFDALGTFLIFVLLGLGADGVFIVFDAWEQSRAGMDYWTEAYGDEAPLYRMSYVWRRTARAMFACNGTTALAFIAVIPSPIMPMAAFGILSALTILHNWLIDVTLVPALLLIWDRYLRHNRLCCCIKRPEKSDKVCCCIPKSVFPGGAGAEDGTGEGAGNANAPRSVEEGRKGAKGAEGPDTFNRTERFFRDRFAPFIHKFRFPIIVLAIAFYGVMIGFTSQLAPATESPQFLPDNHPLWKALLSLRNRWEQGEAENRAELWMVWGIERNDYEGRSKFEFEQEVCDNGPCGSAVFDPSFDPSTKDMQEYLRDVCEDAAEIEAGRGPAGGDFIYDEKISNCLMRDFDGWLKSAHVGEKVPIDDSDKFWDRMHEYLREPSDSKTAGEGYHYVQDKLVKIGKEGEDDEKRMYFLISGVYMDFDAQIFYGLPEIQPGLRAAFEFEEEENKKRPSGQPVFWVTTSSGLFAILRMQEAYISSTVSGVLTALAFAFASLVLFVQNIVVAFEAFVCIAGVVCCTLGLMVLQGWALGPIEAICATIVVGFSVDYVVHYALAFVSSPHRTRYERLEFALLEVGISVQAGALTTMGASAFLLGTTIQFLFKFGVFMLSTVFFSLMTANFAFTALLAIAGPENDLGDLRVLFRRLRGKGESDAEAEQSTPQPDPGADRAVENASAPTARSTVYTRGAYDDTPATQRVDVPETVRGDVTEAQGDMAPTRRNDQMVVA